MHHESEALLPGLLWTDRSGGTAAGQVVLAEHRGARPVVAARQQAAQVTEGARAELALYARHRHPPQQEVALNLQLHLPQSATSVSRQSQIRQLKIRLALIARGADLRYLM